jgi:hypothetical protein
MATEGLRLAIDERKSFGIYLAFIHVHFVRTVSSYCNHLWILSLEKDLFVRTDCKDSHKQFSFNGTTTQDTPCLAAHGTLCIYGSFATLTKRN